MFQSVRELTRTKQATLVVKSTHGEIVAEPEAAAELVANHFKSLFNIVQITAAYRPPSRTGPLDIPISTSEVKRAVKRLKNRRACGPGGIPVNY